jgi:hypothetical protein
MFLERLNLVYKPFILAKMDGGSFQAEEVPGGRLELTESGQIYVQLKLES